MCRWAVILCLSFSFLLCAPTSFAQSQLAERPPRALLPSKKPSDLNPETIELAKQLEIMPLLEELYDPSSKDPPERRHSLRLRILETILEAYFDAASVQAEADKEEGRYQALMDLLSSRRDRAVNINNATNFIASGALNTIGSILGFSGSTPPFPGNLNQMLSGVVQAGMSSYSLKQQTGGKSRVSGAPTIVAELFGRPTDEDTTYPETVWRFFHGKEPGQGGLTRAQVLEQNWIARGHLEPHKSGREKVKLDFVCGVAISGKPVVTLNDLGDLINILEDISTVAEEMTGQLRDLLRMIDSDINYDDR